MSELQAWDFVRRRWQPESHVWDGFDSIPIETARNEVLDLCDGIDYWRKRAEAAEAALPLVDKYAEYYRDAQSNYECGGETQPLDFADWRARKVQP